ncbi:hypothetical protein [Bacillus sp. S10(2024)]
MSNPSIGESDIETTSEAVIQLNIRSGLLCKNSYRFIGILER